MFYRQGTSTMQFMVKGGGFGRLNCAFVLGLFATLLLAGSSASARDLQLATAADKHIAAGNVDIMANGGLGLTLQGAINIYVSDNARLSMVTGATPHLNFDGADRLASVVFRNVARTVSGASVKSANRGMPDLEDFIPATGPLALIPEPSTWVMTIMGASLLLSVQRFRRKKD